MEAATEKMATDRIEERGAVFTRRELVNFILNLAEYTAGKALYKQRLLEPSIGNRISCWRMSSGSGAWVTEFTAGMCKVSV